MHKGLGGFAVELEVRRAVGIPRSQAENGVACGLAPLLVARQQPDESEHLGLIGGFQRLQSIGPPELVCRRVLAVRHDGRLGGRGARGQFFRFLQQLCPRGISGAGSEGAQPGQVVRLQEDSGVGGDDAGLHLGERGLRKKERLAGNVELADPAPLGRRPSDNGPITPVPGARLERRVVSVDSPFHVLDRRGPAQVAK